jgi:aminoglycoside phosphotransferase (APT) family kinase protein
LDAAAIQQGLERLAPLLVGDGCGVEGLTRLSGGASQETWRFVIKSSRGVFILRRSPREGPRNNEALPLTTEAAIMTQAKAAGVRVPEVIHICTPNDGLGEGFIMAFVAGETVARKILRDTRFETARQSIVPQLGHALAAIHALPISGATGILPNSNGLDQLQRYQGIYRGFNLNRPIIELAFKWLSDTAPTAIAPTLVHGDFRLGNIIVDEHGLAAVLDWELTHIGDPREDIGWICVNSWRFGVAHNRVGGLGQLEDLLAAYQAYGGTGFAVSDIKWFQALGSLKWAIMCMIMYEAYRSGADPTIERAMIGRRTSEAEIDLLNIMEGKPHA